MSRRSRQLYRDTEHQKIGGVCAGLGRYFDVDPLLVRVLFVAAIVLSGGSIVAYLLLWWLVEPAPAGYWTESTDAFPPPEAGEDELPGRDAA